MDYPQTLLPTLEALYCLGSRACIEIEIFQPDIVIGLAHSGWMPVTVARALWAETRATAFPPSMRTNIGQEKHDIYKERFKPPMPGYCCGECCGNSTDRLGHYLAWIADQRQWLDTLHSQIQAVYPDNPARILVVDDLFGGYRACYIALGLLDVLYPQAQTYMIAGGKDLTNDFVDAWLSQFAPSLSSEVTSNAAKSDRARYANPWHEPLKPLINGSEDITPESLDWQPPLHPESPALQKLTSVAALETLLAAPIWAASLACRYALDRQDRKIETFAEQDGENRYTLSRAPLKIEPAERLFRHAWLNNGITRREIALMYANLPGGAAEGLKQVKEFAQLHGRGRAAAYMPEESTESWLTAYEPLDRLDLDHHGFAIRGFGEFIPGKLWAGAYPHYEYSTTPKICPGQVEMCKDLLSRGVRYFVDLTVPREYHARWPYQDALAQANQELGLAAEHIRFPLGFRTAPDRQQMSALLQQIRTIIDTRRGIYVHAGHNLEGRTPMVLACLLINQGFDPQQALSQVTDFWLQTLPYLIRLPLSDSQRNFVTRWK